MSYHLTTLRFVDSWKVYAFSTSGDLYYYINNTRFILSFFAVFWGKYLDKFILGILTVINNEYMNISLETLYLSAIIPNFSSLAGSTAVWCLLKVNISYEVESLFVNNENRPNLLFFLS